METPFVNRFNRGKDLTHMTGQLIPPQEEKK